MPLPALAARKAAEKAAERAVEKAAEALAGSEALEPARTWHRRLALGLLIGPPLALVAIVVLFTAAISKMPEQRRPGAGRPASVPGIAAVVLRAYDQAAARARENGCGMRWSIIAGIWKIESGHATFGGASADPETGDVSPPIYGPPTPYGRAMGPAQFIPDTWEAYGEDGDGDGDRDPQNVFDAATATARYLCALADVSTEEGLRRALYGYNHSWEYVDDVMEQIRFYDGFGDSVYGGELITGNGEGGACPVPDGDVHNNWGDPRGGGTRSHQGNDIGAPLGHPAVAVWDGVISSGSMSDPGDAGGISLWLRADNGDEFYYAHNDRNLVGIGDRVTRGQQIATVGHSGNADPSWPHVHFQYHPGGGGPVDPWPLLRSWGCTANSNDPRGG